MYKRIAFLLIFFASVTMGCRKDPVTVNKNDSFNSGTFPQDTTQLFSLLVPVYANLRTGATFGFEFRSHDFNGADHTGDVNYNGDLGWLNVIQNNMSSTTSYANSVWSGFFKGVQMANTFLNSATFFEKNYAKQPADIASLNRMRGEAHFLRAYYYFLLINFFGEAHIINGSGGDKMGLPIIRNAATNLDSTQAARSTVRQTWDFIISDLQQSISLLHGVNWNTMNKGRVSEWAAKSLLGKSYVYTEDWANAKTVLMDVINNSGKTLMPWSKYKYSFSGNSANEFNEESIFELNVEGIEGCYGVFCGNFPITASEALVFSPVVLGDDGTERNAHTTGYANESFHDRNLPRFGFNLPVQDLIPNSAYNPAAGGSPDNPDSILSPIYKAQSMALRTNKTADPRLYVNALQPWIDSASIGNRNDPPSNRAVVRYINLDHSYYGWSFNKYAQIDFDINNNSAAATANIYILRLADVFLLYAEACSKSGDASNALEYINKVKRRAYDFPYNSPSPVDYSSLSSTTNAAAAGDPVLGTNPLYYERWAELMNENNWWFDVCRWQIGKSEAAWYKKTFAGGSILWNDAKSYSWPVPQQEIANNKMMKQNPGY